MHAMRFQWGFDMQNVIDIPIVGQSYHLKDWAIDCQRTLNLYPQVIESGNAPQVSALLPTPGLIKKFELSGRVRGLYALSDRLLVVAGQKLYFIDKANNINEVGEVTGVNRVYFADNSVQVMIVSNNAYSYTIKPNTLVKIEGEEFLGATDVAFLDARFVWVVPKSGKFQWSKLLSTAAGSALDYATAESKSDNLVRAMASNGQLWLIGEKTTEIWASTGNKDLPFQRMGGGVIPTGCVARDSVCQFGGSLIWLTQTEHGQGQIIMTQGYQAVRISNHAIESDIESYPNISDAYSFSYQDNGHAFYVISFPSAKKTWCYDSLTNMWHERSYYNPKTYLHEHHRALTHCFYNGVQMVGDRSNGKIYQLTTTAQKDDGDIIMRERVTPVINPHGLKLIFDELELKLQVGQDVNTNPLVMLEWSDDGGRTWSQGRQESLGAIGDYGKRVIFRRLGQSFSRVFKLRMTDAARLIVLGAKAKVR